MQTMDTKLQTEEQTLQNGDIPAGDSGKVNIVIKRFASTLREAGVPHCIMAWDEEKQRYVFAGAMPEEIGDGTEFSSVKLNRFIRFLELCTDFNKDDFRFNF